MAEDDVVLPRFFKVFLSHMSSESMGIPMSFMEHLEDPLPQTAKLQGTGGRTWTVSFTKIREGAYFTAGWSKFAEDHDLTDRDYLTFVYDGHDTFEVSVYGRHTCKETRAVGETVQIPDSDEEEADDDTNFAEYAEISQNICPVETETNAPAVAGRLNVEVVANICFKTTLKKRPYELLIPKDVVSDNELTIGQTIKYIDEEEGIVVGLRSKWTDRIAFRGWDIICRRNRLKEDDTVKCEILHTRKEVHSLKIHIIRG